MISASQDPGWGESGSGGFAADGTTLGNPLELPKNLLGAVPGVGSCLSCSIQSDITLSPGWGQCQLSVSAVSSGQSHPALHSSAGGVLPCQDPSGPAASRRGGSPIRGPIPGSPAGFASC